MTDLAPSIITRIMREIRDLNREPTLPGISYVEQDDMNSLSEIHAIITGPGKLCPTTYDCDIPVRGMNEKYSLIHIALPYLFFCPYA